MLRQGYGELQSVDAVCASDVKDSRGLHLGGERADGGGEVLYVDRVSPLIGEEREVVLVDGPLHELFLGRGWIAVDKRRSDAHRIWIRGGNQFLGGSFCSAVVVDGRNWVVLAIGPAKVAIEDQVSRDMHRAGSRTSCTGGHVLGARRADLHGSITGLAVGGVNHRGRRDLSDQRSDPFQVQDVAMMPTLLAERASGWGSAGEIRGVDGDPVGDGPCDDGSPEEAATAEDEQAVAFRTWCHQSLGAHGVVAAVDVDHRGRCRREPVAQHGNCGTGHSGGVPNVPSQRGLVVPYFFELCERGDGLRGDRADGACGNQVESNIRWAVFACQVPIRRLQSRFRDAHPVVRRPGDGGIEVQSYNAPALRHQRRHDLGQGLVAVRRDLECDLHVVPRGPHEVLAEAGLGSESDRMEGSVDPAPLLLQGVAHLADVVGVRDVELEDLGFDVELAGGSFRERQAATCSGQNKVGAFGLRELSDTKGERGVGEHTGNEDVLSIEDSHPGSLDHQGGNVQHALQLSVGRARFAAQAFEVTLASVAPMTDMAIFDTATGVISPITVDDVVRIYICGITPYDATHLGHAATYVTYDVLHRRLVDRGHEVHMVRNITDVDNDLLERAKRDGVHYLDLAFGQKRRFDDDLAALGVQDPWSEPRATSAIPEIRGLIAQLLEQEAAYAVDGTVYFDHQASDSFGSVSGYSRVDMRAIGAGRGEDPHDPNKRHPLDAVVWQASLEDEPSWEAPWGAGRPGWHIECTALSLRELATIDIHGGGCDLVYPHHEFCAAQLEALGESPVGHWMHQSCVHLAGEPMSKSTGNLIFVRDLLDVHEPMAIRLAVLSQHYRTKNWEWKNELLAEAEVRLGQWRLSADVATGSPDELMGAVRAALDNDLDVPSALTRIDAAAADGVNVVEAAKLLGVDLV